MSRAEQEIVQFFDYNSGTSSPFHTELPILKNSTTYQVIE